jgi:hypothetical protein
LAVLRYQYTLGIQFQGNYAQLFEHGKRSVGSTLRVDLGAFDPAAVVLERAHCSRIGSTEWPQENQTPTKFRG